MLESLYVYLMNLARMEKEISEMLGRPFEYTEERIKTKRQIRRLAKIDDPAWNKSLLEGGKRSVSDGEYGYYEFWYEYDDPEMTDEEVARYVDREYRWTADRPGATFTMVYWKRTAYGLRIITYTGLDI